MKNFWVVVILAWLTGLTIMVNIESDIAFETDVKLTKHMVAAHKAIRKRFEEHNHE